jgi:cephalosporin hydroxylase
MQKLANILAVLGVTIAAVTVTVAYWMARYLGEGVIDWNTIRPYTDILLILAVSLVISASLVRLVLNKDVKLVLARDARIFFWLAGAVLLGSVGFLLTKTIKPSNSYIISEFHKIYFDHKGYVSSYLGVASAQYPTDNWVMQEIISELNPDFVIETGTWRGGTALYYATILEKLNDHGKVITIDVNPYDPKVEAFKTWRERVEFIKGSSVSPEVVEAVKKRVQGHKVLVTLDSLHSKSHVLKELELYAPLVSKNSYIVVQDTQNSGHPIQVDFEGPWEAVQEFLKANKNFVIDQKREKHLLTANPSGYLRRVR